jgi:UDP-N-acetylglucosamine--N-acetylmuramyl-(pentapeptide) pyrophosphoryl-undecaprenol N-acetylglucosamine transferase
MGNKQVKRITFVLGGTGGHIYPALSIAEIIKKMIDVKFNFIISTELARKIDKTYKYKPTKIICGGIVRKNIFTKIINFIKNGIGFFQSLWILIKNRPKILVATGSYISVPVSVAAKILFIPCVVLEQNIVPGVATRIVSKLSKFIFVSFEETKRYFKENKVKVLGNPIRKIENIPDKEKIRQKYNLTSKFTILIFGGSQGSSVINDLIMFSLPFFRLEKIQIIWITGEKEYEKIKEKVSKFPQIYVASYIENIYELYTIVDLVICRAGASTIAELIAFQLPSIIIPIPKSSYNHQLENAKWLERKGATIVFEEEKITPTVLIETINDLMDNPDELKSMKEACKNIYIPNSAENIANEIIKLC